MQKQSNTSLPGPRACGWLPSDPCQGPASPSASVLPRRPFPISSSGVWAAHPWSSVFWKASLKIQHCAYTNMVLSFCSFASSPSGEIILRSSDDGPGLPSLERSVHAGPGTNNTLCSLCSLMWITIWSGTPVTPIRTGMEPLPAA